MATSVVFARSRGVVVRLSGQVGTFNPARIAIEDTNLVTGNSVLSAIITQASLDETENMQIQPSMSPTSYLYGFGRNPGQLILGGVGFAQLCSTRSESSSGFPASYAPGYINILQLYNNIRFSQRGSHVNLRWGGMVYRAFAVRCGINVADADTMTGQWALHFVTFEAQAGQAII